MESQLNTRMNQKTAKAFWNARRIRLISSMPCRDLLQALEDGEWRTAKELSAMTGRTPGALHSPLRRLWEEGILNKEPQPQQKPGRGRPSKVYRLDPGAARGLPREAEETTTLAPDGNEAALRMLNRTVRKVLTENRTLTRRNQPPLTNLCSIEYGFLTEREARSVERKFHEIRSMLGRKRLDRTGRKKRFRIGMVLVQDLKSE